MSHFVGPARCRCGPAHSCDVPGSCCAKRCPHISTRDALSAARDRSAGPRSRSLARRSQLFVRFGALRGARGRYLTRPRALAPGRGASRAPRGRLSVARGPCYLYRGQLTRKRRTLTSKRGQRALTMRTLAVVFAALRRRITSPPLHLPSAEGASKPRQMRSQAGTSLLRREKALMTCFGVSPIASTALSRRSTLTDGSPDSIFATRDWLEPTNSATFACERLRRIREARRHSARANFISTKAASSLLRSRNSRASPTFQPVAPSRAFFALFILLLHASSYRFPRCRQTSFMCSGVSPESFSNTSRITMAPPSILY